MSYEDSNNNSNPVILFDGVCNLCNGFIQFVIKRDPENKFRFAPLQSEFAKREIRAHGIEAKGMNTVYLLKNGELYDQSDVAMEVFKDLSGLWPFLALLRFIPRFIKNPVYNFIAKNRYKWFGKKNSCMIPTKALQSRFYQ